jgi:3-methyladenine DNA glycosylase AlkD
VLSPLIKRHPELIPGVVKWTGSPNQWLRRGAVVAFVPLARRGERITEAYAMASRLLDDPEDLMHKAVGWLLREAGKRDPRRLERYLLSKGARVPRTTLRYAIERFPERERRRLLDATRG